MQEVGLFAHFPSQKKKIQQSSEKPMECNYIASRDPGVALEFQS